MNRFVARTGAVGVACALLSAGAIAGAVPAGPAAAPEVAATITPTAETPVVVPIPVNLPGEAPGVIGAPLPAQTTAAVPLPPGVYIGLFGLASAAVARRRYMKRR